MDYTLNRIPKETGKNLKFENSPFVEFPNLKFCEVEDGIAAFDATEFCNLSEIEPIGYKVFSRISKLYIERIVEAAGLDRGKLFYQNYDGHELMNGMLAPLFLAFMSPSIFLYFYTSINELMLEGLVFSDTYIAEIASKRLPTNVIREIIDQRENGEGQNPADGV